VTREVTRTSRRGLTYGARGDGRPVVLVHGWCLDRTVWMYLEASLVEVGYRVVTPALAGYGASAHLDAHRSLAEHGEDVADLIDELGLDDAVLCGFAFGAGVILSMPDYSRVGGLVSIGIPSAATASYTRMPNAIAKDWPLFAQRSAAAILSQQHSDATLDWLTRIFGATPIDSALAGVDILSRFEPIELEQAWTVPTIFVHGADDSIVHPSVSAECAEAFGGEYAEVEASGHLVVIDQRRALHDIVVGMLRR
jgi:pimeloyl-ACP methyl ester carboxylesterase